MLGNPLLLFTVKFPFRTKDLPLSKIRHQLASDKCGVSFSHGRLDLNMVIALAASTIPEKQFPQDFLKFGIATGIVRVFYRTVTLSRKSFMAHHGPAITVLPIGGYCRLG
jgi:hypothetical protein